MKKRGIFKNDTLMAKNVPRGSENAFVSEKNIKAIFHSKLGPTALIITTFASGEFF
jgi:hypothetical protein